MKTILLKTSIDYSFSRNKSPAEATVNNKSNITFSTSNNDILEKGDYVTDLDEYQFNVLIKLSNVVNTTWGGSMRKVEGYISKSIQYFDNILIKHTTLDTINKEYSFTEFHRRLKNTINSKKESNIDSNDKRLKLKDIYVYVKDQTEADLLVSLLKEYVPNQVQLNSAQLSFKIGSDTYHILKLRSDNRWVFGLTIDNRTKIDIETFKKLLKKERNIEYGKIPY